MTTTIVGMKHWVTPLVSRRIGVPAVRVWVITVVTRESIALVLIRAVCTM